ncbi:hypothetical protein GCM10007036_14280 [Alsobacter metallidurans]|uniref:Major capsid protein n=1 Tax=Alsobacter metallidurans TaxID=340221 RepID=A0A917MGG3_9HYPH|nr:hypothetical protein [Alsobacter metallidurans]GGH14753.1 hypothetical protein GCM10007036_14280 [Alsobacter metallidurans]
MTGQVQAQFQGLQAAADFLGTGAIEVNKYESEILDIVRRTSTALNRLPKIPATGHPHRYFEQTAIATAAFTDPRAIAPTAQNPTRVERSAMIKAITAQSNLSLFDVDVTRMQGQFAYIESRDINDIVNAVAVLQASNIWNGTDTSLTTPTSIQYVGLLNQITLQSTVAPGASIIDGIKAQVAAMMANQTYVVRPTAIYLNPILADYIDREAKAGNVTIGSLEVQAGVTVPAIQTQAGLLPLITEPFMPTLAANTAGFGFSAPGAGIKTYFAVIVTENMVEIPYVHGGDGNPNPRLFQLGLLANLLGQYVAINFSAIVAKGPSYAHATVAVQRP